MIAEYHTVYSALTDINGTTGDIITVAPSAPIEVVGFGFTSTTALVGTSAVMDLSYIASAVARDQQIDIDGTANDGTITLAASAIGLHHYKDVDHFEVDPGDQIIIDITTGIGTSGSGVAYIRYRERAAAGTRFETNSTEY